jgi:methylated-DNA-[protein]-cysteine S-methyltransferase
MTPSCPVKTPVYYTLVYTAFGCAGIVWHGTARGAGIVRIFLPAKKAALVRQIQKNFLSCRRKSCPEIDAAGAQLERFFAGEAIDFNPAVLDFSVCSAFQKKVLLAEAKIPRGYISTYGRIARKLGIPSASRAVGHALATNPFPPVIPCHRTVRSDGALGGFQGGLGMKKALLEYEGIEFSVTGNAVMNRVFY